MDYVQGRNENQSQTKYTVNVMVVCGKQHSPVHLSGVGLGYGTNLFSFPGWAWVMVLTCFLFRGGLGLWY